MRLRACGGRKGGWARGGDGNEGRMKGVKEEGLRGDGSWREGSGVRGEGREEGRGGRHDEWEK